MDDARPPRESQQTASRASSKGGAGMKLRAMPKRKAPAGGRGFLFGSAGQKPKRKAPTISCVSKSPVRVGKPVTAPLSALPPWK